MNDKKPFPTSLLLFVLIIFAVQGIATYFYWYWRIWWFDMPMHFLGGLWVGLSMLWLFFLSGRFGQNGKRTTGIIFAVGIFSVFVIAILWEVFEYIVQLLFPSGTPYDMLDTLSDIFWGVTGGTIASFSFTRKRYLENQKVERL